MDLGEGHDSGVWHLRLGPDGWDLAFGVLCLSVEIEMIKIQERESLFSNPSPIIFSGASSNES